MHEENEVPEWRTHWRKGDICWLPMPTLPGKEETVERCIVVEGAARIDSAWIHVSRESDGHVSAHKQGYLLFRSKRLAILWLSVHNKLEALRSRSVLVNGAGAGEKLWRAYLNEGDRPATGRVQACTALHQCEPWDRTARVKLTDGSDALVKLMDLFAAKDDAEECIRLWVERSRIRREDVGEETAAQRERWETPPSFEWWPACVSQHTRLSAGEGRS